MKRSEQIPRLLLFLVGLALCVLNAVYVALDTTPQHWDPANHVMHSMRIANRDGDVDAERQVYQLGRWDLPDGSEARLYRGYPAANAPAFRPAAPAAGTGGMP